MSLAIWQPKQPHDNQLWQFMHFVMQQQRLHFTSYQDLHTWSIQNIALFGIMCVHFIIFNATPSQKKF